MALFYVFFAFAFVLRIVSKTISTQLRKRLLATFTAVDDIPLLGNRRKPEHRISGTAVICGGSIAGLLSARVCSDHFENVVMIEPEEWVTKTEVVSDTQSSPVLQKRSRVPQYTTFHGYQSFTTRVLRKLFRDFDSEVVKAGGRLIPSDSALHWSGIPIKAPWHKYTSTTFPEVPSLTRPAFETILRRLVLAVCPNVKYVAGTVIGVVKSESSSDLHSVRIRSREGEERLVSAVLVVDCTGPALGGFRWLQSLASAPPTSAETHVKSSSPIEDLKVTYDPKLAYSTCTFSVPPDLIPSINALGITHDFETARFLLGCYPDPRIDSRMFGVTRKENNALQFVCGGWDFRGRMTCVGDMKDFISQMKMSRPHPGWLPRLLDLLEEEQVPVTYVHVRCPASAYVQYHLADNIPSNFVAIGDSILQLNPIRGQGVGKVFVEAVTLNALLARAAPTHLASSASLKGTGGVSLPKDLSRTYFALQAKRTGALWDTYKSEDYAWKTTIPAKGDDLEHTGSWRRALGSVILQLVIKDREVAAAWWHTIEWQAPPTDLLSPMIILKIVWMKIQGCVGL